MFGKVNKEVCRGCTHFKVQRKHSLRIVTHHSFQIILEWEEKPKETTSLCFDDTLLL